MIVRKIVLYIVSCSVLFACDPPYRMFISNRSGYDMEIQVKAHNIPIDFYESGEDVFQIGLHLRSDTLLAAEAFVPLLLPDCQTVAIHGLGIAMPKEEAIIVGSDTLDVYRNFTLKKSMWHEYKWGFVISEPETLVAVTPNEILRRAKRNGKWGFIDYAGKTVIPFMYEHAQNFSNGIAPVKLNNKWGGIDRTGKLVIPCKYDGLSQFSDDGTAKAFYGADPRERKYVVIDKQGNEL